MPSKVIPDVRTDSKSWAQAALIGLLMSCNGPDLSVDCEHVDYQLCDIRLDSCQDAVFDQVRCLRGDNGVAVDRPRVEALSAKRVADLLEPAPEPETSDPEAKRKAEAQAAESARIERALALIGMLDRAPQDADADSSEPDTPTSDDEQKELEDELFLEGLLGFYTSGTREIVLVDQPGGEYDGELAVATLAHEYVHALQDQQFGLERYLDAHDWSHDSNLAMISVIEGEATLLEQFYLARAADTEFDVAAVDWVSIMAEQTGYADGAVTRLPSPVVSSSWVFPYTYGAHEVALAWQDDRAPGVVGLWRSEGLSTQRFLAHRHGAEANRSSALSPGDFEKLQPFELLGQDVLGAWLMHAFLVRVLHQSPVPELALRLSGDVLAAFSSNDSEDVGIIWRLNWQTEAAAEQFVDAVRRGAPPSEGRWAAQRTGRFAVLVAATGESGVFQKLSGAASQDLDRAFPQPRLAAEDSETPSTDRVVAGRLSSPQRPPCLR